MVFGGPEIGQICALIFIDTWVIIYTATMGVFGGIGGLFRAWMVVVRGSVCLWFITSKVTRPDKLMVMMVRRGLGGQIL